MDMDYAMVVLTAFATLAAIASAVFAFFQAKAAGDSKIDARAARDEARVARDESERLAREANDAFVRQAEAQEEANRIKLQEMTPEAWSVTHLSGSRFRATNTSGKLIIVDDFDVTPDGSERFVSIQTNHLDKLYAYGDSFEFVVAQVWGASAEKLTIRFRHEDDAPGAHRTFHISL